MADLKYSETHKYVDSILKYLGTFEVSFTDKNDSQIFSIFLEQDGTCIGEYRYQILKEKDFLSPYNYFGQRTTDQPHFFHDKVLNYSRAIKEYDFSLYFAEVFSQSNSKPLGVRSKFMYEAAEGGSKDVDWYLNFETGKTGFVVESGGLAYDSEEDGEIWTSRKRKKSFKSVLKMIKDQVDTTIALKHGNDSVWIQDLVTFCFFESLFLNIKSNFEKKLLSPEVKEVGSSEGTLIDGTKYICEDWYDSDVRCFFRTYFYEIKGREKWGEYDHRNLLKSNGKISADTKALGVTTAERNGSKFWSITTTSHQSD